jgi:hypothetical protein
MLSHGPHSRLVIQKERIAELWHRLIEIIQLWEHRENILYKN